MKFLPLLGLAVLLAAAPMHAETWPMWRGPRLDGTSLERKVPVKWSATENVLWRTELPGGGHASPIVWGDKVFTIAADPPTGERLLLCLDRQDGKILWRQTVLTTALERK